MSEITKVLKVTYGNFSCRLEGFDDSVETLKSVVGYFHDLAGPAMFSEDTAVVPDLETLERVVTEGGAGDVDVTHDDNGIDLRVRSRDISQAVTSQADDADVAFAELDNDTDAGTLSGFTDEDTDDTDFVATQDDADQTDDDADMIDAEASAPDAMQDDDAEADDAHDTTVASDVEDEIAEADEDDADGSSQLSDDARIETAEDDVHSDDQDTFAMDAETEAAPDEGTAQMPERAPLVLSEIITPVAEEPVPDTSDDLHDDDAYAESVADKLQRIRAVVGRGAAPADESYAEDLSESDAVVAPKATNPLAQRLAELAKRNSELMDADARNDGVAPMQLGQDARVDTPKPSVTADEAESEMIASDENLPSMEMPADYETADTADTDTRRSTPLVLTDPEPTSASYDADEGRNDSFDLHEEVAQIERELAARRGNELARHGLPRSVEDAMSRILTQTDVELDLQETRDGRDAFAQLKAAVAATEAARQLGDSGPKTREVTRMFRDELGAIHDDATPAKSGPASLKVVHTTTGKSTLREVAPLNEAAARLREIAKMTEEEDDEVTFGSFLAGHDVTDLSDRLEAAAAFLSFIENETDFSRPQLMRVVQSEVKEEISREDGLRSFGRLLRQSRIVKLVNGRFQVADNTRFRPTSGRAAQG